MLLLLGVGPWRQVRRVAEKPLWAVSVSGLHGGLGMVGTVSHNFFGLLLKGYRRILEVGGH